MFFFKIYRCCYTCAIFKKMFFFFKISVGIEFEKNLFLLHSIIVYFYQPPKRVICNLQTQIRGEKKKNDNIKIIIETLILGMIRSSVPISHFSSMF